MRYEQTVAPSTYPVTVDEVKTHCLITDESDSQYLRGLIAKATRYVERRTERQLLTATWVARCDSFPAEIELRILPVASITSVQYVDTDGDTQTLSASSYQSDIESPDRPGRIMPAYGQTWPSTRGETYNAVTVTFTAGYGTASSVPDTFKHAIYLLVNWWFDNREPVNVGNIVNAMPFSVESLLACDSWGSYS